MLRAMQGCGQLANFPVHAGCSPWMPFPTLFPFRQLSFLSRLFIVPNVQNMQDYPLAPGNPSRYSNCCPRSLLLRAIPLPRRAFHATTNAGGPSRAQNFQVPAERSRWIWSTTNPSFGQLSFLSWHFIVPDAQDMQYNSLGVGDRPGSSTQPLQCGSADPIDCQFRQLSFPTRLFIVRRAKVYA